MSTINRLIIGVIGWTIGLGAFYVVYKRRFRIMKSFQEIAKNKLG